MSVITIEEMKNISLNEIYEWQISKAERLYDLSQERKKKTNKI